MAATKAQQFWEQGLKLFELFITAEQEFVANLSKGGNAEQLALQLRALKLQMKQRFADARDQYRICCEQDYKSASWQLYK